MLRNFHTSKFFHLILTILVLIVLLSDIVIITLVIYCDIKFLLPTLTYRTVGNFHGSNFLWFGELRRFRGFIFSWHTYSNLSYTAKMQ